MRESPEDEGIHTSDGYEQSNTREVSRPFHNGKPLVAQLQNYREVITFWF